MGEFKYTVNKKQTGNSQRPKGMEEYWTGSQGPEWPVVLVLKKKNAWNYLDENEI